MKDDRIFCRCVKKVYTDHDDGNYVLIWNDRGSGTSRNVALWRNDLAADSSDRIFTNTFTSFATFDRPTGRPYTLSDHSVKPASLSRPSDVSISLYEQVGHTLGNLYR